MLYSNVLIANRGEIAVRLIRACERLGLRSVAVFSDADATAPYVRLADVAVHIGPPEAGASYLNVDRIIDAAERAGAEAIHPGYGFLAENADFARRCVDSGLVFVGPSADIIAAMGAKIEAKRIATAAGIACVPGYHGDDQSDARFQREAERIGTPLLIKASAGGGGRGMRRVDTLDTLAGDLALARREAEAAFADPALLLESYVEAPRHIEVQILADRHGNVRHLFERDCSIQRNYQKIIEEAPAPNLGAEQRARILGDAVKLATEIGYDNAGTVEFVADAVTGEAYFLEMNTRLQVEHPVTEMVTGFDLAEWQLRIAGGEALTFEQSDVACNGWAIEARVAAEDPAAGYRPETGTISSYAEPAMAELRIDSGVECGSLVSPYYDSMIAKVIAKGADRDSAIRNLRRGLTRFRIGGVGVNTGFLYDVLGLEEFRARRHLTSCLPAAFPDGWKPPPVTAFDAALAALARHIRFESGGGQTPWSTLGAWRLSEQAGRNGRAYYYLRAGEATFDDVTVLGRAGTYTVEYAGRTVLSVRYATVRDDCLLFQQDDRQQRIGVLVADTEVTLHRDTDSPAFSVCTAEDVLLDDPEEAVAGGDSVVAPTPGLVTEVLVSTGQRVEAGEPVIVMEAMKLLQQLHAPVSGVAQSIHCRPGDTVDGGDCLVSIEPTGTDNEKQEGSND